MSEEKCCDYVAELVKNGVIAFVPSGNSMWPTLKNKGQSVIVQAKKERLKPMDVALYRRADGKNVLHRVIKVVNDGYIICGDSQFVLENVREDQVYGVMTGFYRGKKYVETSDPAYVKKVEKWYAKKRTRKFRVKTFFFFVGLKSLPKRAWHKIFGGKRADKKEEKND